MMKFFFAIALLATFFTASVCGTDEQEQGPFPAGANLRRRNSDTGPIPETVGIDGEDRDTELIAEAMGVDIPTAKKHISLQRSFKALINKLERHDDFAEAAMARNPGDDVEVFFKNKVPDEFTQDIEDFESKTKVKVQKKSTKKSLKEKEKVVKKITKLLEKKGFSEVGHVIDVDNLQVTAVIPKDNAEDDMSKDKEINYEKLEKKAKKILGKDLDADELDGVLLFLSSDSINEDYHTRGGRLVYNPNGCTSGFSVVNGAGTTGIATAGHCNVNTYDTEQAGESDYPMSLQAQHIGAWGDFEWHTTSHFELPEYWASPTDLWYVNAVDSSFSKNEWVCGYSRVRGIRKCDQIEKTSVGHNGASNLIAMYNNNMRSGDSGGPWSWSNTAAGFVTGYMTVRTEGAL
jgi:hypothetical protein